MTDSIRTECPNCHAQYQIGLNKLSTGKSKAKCGRCGTSFSIKDNLSSTSFLKPKDKKIATSSVKSAESKRKPAPKERVDAEYTQDFSLNSENTKQSKNTSSSLFDTSPAPDPTPRPNSKLKPEPNSKPEPRLDIATEKVTAKQTQASAKSPTKASIETDDIESFGQEWETDKTTLQESNGSNSNNDAQTTSKTTLHDDPISVHPTTSNAQESTVKSITEPDTADPNTIKSDTIVSDTMEEDTLIHDEMQVDSSTEDEDIDDDWEFDENLLNANLSNDPFNEPSPAEEDESWLEDLIANEEETPHTHTPEEQQAITPTSDSDLSDLLDDLGVESSEPTAPTQEDAREMVNKRLKSKPKNPVNKGSIVTSLLWLIGCIVLSFLLLAQYAVFNLNNLIKDPEHRAKLQSFCDVVTCALPHADIESIAIGGRQYKASQIQQGGTDILATITNLGDSEQLYPNLKIELYDANGIIGDFVAMPSQYLLTSHNIVSPSQTTQFMVTVDVKTTDIDNIKIIPFY